MSKLVTLVFLLIFCLPAWPMPDIRVEHGKSLEGFARIRIINNTPQPLACFVAIDGYKKRFVLGALKPSLWYKATDMRFNYKNFSTWCDYLEFHPQFERYRTN
ncbi:hypothetical protein tloyanaT_23830 [Thalassotalea loyana]|uniref:Uncharacterized protein n=1 Tax=Thalassotalea loyana TaxID=280483 RepID=A0ABQ6HDD5_9GAMM|nr:hypothetical protein [Thalassotalea loyana]GLX86130.1 hypothetical protein tloyanaT_23830 [Thalassotalea loyana]